MSKDNYYNFEGILKNIADFDYDIDNIDIDSSKKFYNNAIEFVKTFSEYYKTNVNDDFKKDNKDFIKDLSNVTKPFYESFINNEQQGIVIDKIEYLKRHSLFVEISNKISHYLERYYKSNKKDLYLKMNKQFCYQIKEISISKLAKNTLGKENLGIISGITRDLTKTDNSYVYALDIPHYGQVSWHISDVESFIKTIGKSEKELEYPFEIDKYANKRDLYGKKVDSMVHNDNILNKEYDSSEVGIHNMIDMKIPEGKEYELKLVLQIYEEMKRLAIDGNEKIEDSLNYDEHNIERRVKKACLKHGLPSKENFDLLVNRVVEMVYKEQTYDKQLLRDWRDKEYESRDKPKSS